MQIRPARADEADALHALVLRSYAAYPEQIGVRPAPMDDDYGARVAAGQAFVAYERDEPVGVLVLISHDDYLLIDNIAIDPSCQGQGLGRVLLEFAQARAVELGLSELRLYTNAAMTENQAIYTHLGYRETAREEGSGFKRVHFMKRI